MPAVLCFGDSNTWGSDPANDSLRFAADIRYPGILAAELGAGWEVFEEGLGGRTTAFDRLPTGFRSGKDLLPAIVETHAPLDVVVILLGTNDVSLPYLSAGDIARGAGELVAIVQGSDYCGPRTDQKDSRPRPLLIAPPVVGPLLQEDLALCPSAVEVSRELGPAYDAVAARMGCAFLDLAPVVTTSAADGWHWGAGEHAKAGRAIADAIRDITA